MGVFPCEIRKRDESPSHGGHEAVECVYMDKLTCLCTSTKGCREVVHAMGQRKNRRYLRISVLQDQTLSVSGNVDGDKRLPPSSGGDPHRWIEKQKDIQTLFEHDLSVLAVAIRKEVGSMTVL